MITSSAFCYPIITIVTGLDCPYNCFIAVTSNNVRSQVEIEEPQNVAEEFRFIAENFPKWKK